MIIVTGAAVILKSAYEQALALALAHVRQSRTEDGCLSHAVHQGAENAATLFFFEEWRDRDALVAHFAQPASRAFVKALGGLCAEPPSLRIYEAAPAAL